MTASRAAFAATILLCCAVPVSAQSVSVRFDNGRVTLSARNAPLRTILAEWARVGGATIVNADQVSGGPLTLELTDVTEQKALSVLLRSVSGYIVAPRRSAAAGASSFDRILILPASAAVTTAARAPAAASRTQPIVVVPDGAGVGDALSPDGVPRGIPAGLDAQQIQQLREEVERVRGRDVDAADVDPSATEDQQDDARPGRRSRGGGTSFGNTRGSSRPGEISPTQDEGQGGSPFVPGGNPTR